MASIEDIRAGKAYIEIGTKDSALVAGLARAAQRLQRWGEAVRGVGLQIGAAGAALFAPLALGAKAFADQGEQLELASKQTGIAVETISTLGYAAQQSGVQMEDLTGAMAKMSRTLTEASEGNKTAEESFARLGLSAGKLLSLSPDDRLGAIADALAKIQDPSIRAGMAMQIFGRSAAQLLPLLSQGSAGVASLQQHARDLGLQWSGADAEAGEKFAHTLKDLWDVLNRGAEVVGEAVAPAMTILANGAIKVTQFFEQWIPQHKALVQALALTGAAAVGVGTGLVVLGTAVQATGIAMGTFASALGIVRVALSPLTGMIGVATSAFSGMASIVGKVAGLGGSLVTGILPALKSIGEAVWWVINPLGMLYSAGSLVLSGIMALINPFTLLGAASVALGAAILAVGGYFLYTSGALDGALDGVGKAIRNAIGDVPGLFNSAKSAAVGAFGTIEKGVASAANAIQDAFAQAGKVIMLVLGNTSSAGQALGAGLTIGATYFQEAWAGAVGYVKNLWLSLGGFLSDWGGAIGQTIMDALGPALDYIKGMITTVWGWIQKMSAKLTDAIFLGQARSSADQDYSGKPVTMGLARRYAIEKVTAENSDQKRPSDTKRDRAEIERIAKEVFDSAQGQEFTTNDLESIAQMRFAQMKKTTDAGSGSDRELADLKTKFDAEMKHIADLAAARKAAREKETADQKAANDAAAADAEAKAKKARDDYEKVLQDSFKKSGQPSLLDDLQKQLGAILHPFTPSDDTSDKASKAMSDTNLTAKPEEKNFGTFSKYVAAAESRGAGASKGPAEKTAEHAAKISAGVATIAAGIHQLIGGGAMTFT